MGYVRITIHLHGGGIRSGIRHFPEPMKLEEIRAHALHLSAEALGRGNIEDVTVQEMSADSPEVVALILNEQSRSS